MFARAGSSRPSRGTAAPAGRPLDVPRSTGSWDTCHWICAGYLTGVSSQSENHPRPLTPHPSPPYHYLLSRPRRPGLLLFCGVTMSTKTATAKNYDVKDLGLAPEGKRRILWADRDMPV